jgi:DNA-binding MarR family transcriptional regulator
MTTTRDPLTPYITGWELVIAARRFQHRMEVAMDQALEGFAITFAQYRALEAIDATPRMHISALARKLRLTRQATQAVTKKLVRADYLRVEDHGYVKTVHITQRGHQHLRLLRDSASRIPTALEAALDYDERAALHALLRKADLALEPRELERADANPPPAAPTTGG